MPHAKARSGAFLSLYSPIWVYPTCQQYPYPINGILLAKKALGLLAGRCGLESVLDGMASAYVLPSLLKNMR